MRKLARCLVVLELFCPAAIAPAQEHSLDARIDQELPGLVTAYKSLYQAPELSR